MDLGFSLLRKLFPNLPAFGEMGWVIRGTYPEEGGLRRAKYNCFINTGWRRHCNFLLLWLLRFLLFFFWQELPILYWLCHPLFSRFMVWFPLVEIQSSRFELEEAIARNIFLCSTLLTLLGKITPPCISRVKLKWGSLCSCLQSTYLWYRGTLSTHSLFLKPHTRSITFFLYYTKQETLNVSVTRRRKRESYSEPGILPDWPQL